MGTLDLFSLKGRNALVTGATAGVGRAVAVALGSAGALVVLTGRRVAELERTKSLIEDEGGTAIVIAADLNDDAEIRRLADTAKERTGGLHILVNSAAAPRGPTWGPANTMSLDGVDLTMRMNFRVPFELTRLVAADMIAEARGGSVIHVTSTAAHFGTANMSVYAASKAALTRWAEATAAEWGPDGVRVNCVAAGAVSTELTRSNFPDAEAERVARGGELVSLRRLALPDDIAPVVVFLASRAADYISGVAIRVDGGKVPGAMSATQTKKPTA
jgi:NAD(P)-dependent dehydrogenase (short-subunit alcohol dehydrogenase family)